jgi:hypothetical protein
VNAPDIAKAISDGSVLKNPAFYLIFFLISTIGSAVGTYLIAQVTERTKGAIAKGIWYSQESWREKYRIYSGLISACEDVAQSLWQIAASGSTLATFPPGNESTIEDGLNRFPEHREYISAAEKAYEKIADLSVGAELMLDKKANDALAKIRGAVTRSTHVINLSYWQRMELQSTAAGEAKVLLIESAKQDLKI